MDFSIRLAKELNYDKVQRLEEILEEKYGELNEIVQSSSKETLSIIFLEGLFLEVTNKNVYCHYFYERNRRPTIDYITIRPELDEKFLRKVFTGLELILYKICHVILEDQRRSYNFEHQKTTPRFNRLKEHVQVENWLYYREIFGEIISARNYFSHSFIDVEKIPYRGVPLDVCFGRSSKGRRQGFLPSTLGFTFVDDLRFLITPLLNLFSSHQLKQIDREKFFKLCDHLLKSRSLIR